MGVPFTRRLLSLLILLLFAVGSSYHNLCAAGLIECAPCITEVAADGCGKCKTCEQSAKASESIPPVKFQNAAFALIQLALTFSTLIISSPPALPAEPPQFASADLPLASILLDIKQSIPIRGPSVIL